MKIAYKIHLRDRLIASCDSQRTVKTLQIENAGSPDRESITLSSKLFRLIIVSIIYSGGEPIKFNE